MYLFGSVSKGNIAIHMEIANESDISNMVNRLTESCPSNVTIIPNPPYQDYMTAESKQKINRGLSFFIPPVAGYGVTLIWIIASNYY